MKTCLQGFQPGSVVIKLFSFSTHLSMEFILLINVKMPTTVGILTFVSRINDWLSQFKSEIPYFLSNLMFMSSLNFMLSLVEHEKKFCNLVWTQTDLLSYRIVVSDIETRGIQKKR